MSTKRDVGFLEWSDPRGWMEAMRGPRWRGVLKAENERFDAAVARATGGQKEGLTRAIAAFESARLDAEIAGEWRLGDFLLRPQPGGAVAWSWSESEPILAGDIDIVGDTVAYTIDVKSGGEQYEVVVRDLKRRGLNWTYRHPGGGLAASVAVLGSRVYCLEADEPLRYKRLISIDFETGGQRRIEYEEEDSTAVLGIQKGEAGCLFLLVDLAGRKTLHHISEKGVRQLTKAGEVSIVPVGYHSSDEAQPCYFVRSDGFRGRWIPRGRSLQTLFRKTLPTEMQKSEDYGIDYAVLQAPGAIVTREHGQRTLWIGGKKALQWFGEIEIHPWLLWNRVNRDPLSFLIHRPGALPQRGIFNKERASGIQMQPLEIYAKNVHSGFATSADGTKVRWVLCCDSKPRAVMATVYGAYGLPTRMTTSRWRPYLEKGIAIGFALVRGGGDHTESWAAAGQVAGKEKGIEDFEACVEAMRRVAGGLPKKAIGVFGRSAGGYIVGAAAARKQRAFGTAYTEVPYVDVLRTASNLSLPLTKFEYEEFGDPAHSIADFETILRLSPVDVAVVAPKGIMDDLMVVCRTSENDRQVYAYESVKWIEAMRSRGTSGAEKKVVHIASDQGHFSFGGLASLQRAEDYLIISEKMLKS
jgi:hypothetical protein